MLEGNEHSKVSRINLIDLAGSERSSVAQTSGERLKVKERGREGEERQRGRGKEEEKREEEGERRDWRESRGLFCISFPSPSLPAGGSQHQPLPAHPGEGHLFAL